MKECYFYKSCKLNGPSWEFFTFFEIEQMVPNRANRLLQLSDNICQPEHF